MLMLVYEVFRDIFIIQIYFFYCDLASFIRSATALELAIYLDNAPSLIKK